LSLALAFNRQHEPVRNANCPATGPGLDVGGDYSPAVPLWAVCAVFPSARLRIRASVLPDKLLHSTTNGERCRFHLSEWAERCRLIPTLACLDASVPPLNVDVGPLEPKCFASP
jgi:hypothetical protein